MSEMGLVWAVPRSQQQHCHNCCSLASASDICVANYTLHYTIMLEHRVSIGRQVFSQERLNANLECIAVTRCHT